MLCFEKRGGKLVVYLEGELDHNTAAGMRAEIDNQLRDRSVMDLIIDMGGVTFMDSSGIGWCWAGTSLCPAGADGCGFPGREPGDRLMGLSGVYDLVEKQS